MKFLGKTNALCLSPHPDDTAFGLGGLVKKYTDTTFHMIYLSNGTATDTSTGPDRYVEDMKFWKELGVTNVLMYPSFTHSFNSPVCEILTEIEKLNIEFDVIFGPTYIDSHYEHRITNELMSALSRFKPATIVEYRCSSTLSTWAPTLFVKLTGDELWHKIECMRKVFTSQLDASYFSTINLILFHSDYISSKRGVEYCEQFKVNQLYVE